MGTWNKLALKGGGAKGYLYIGVADALQKLGLLDQIETISGASVGSIGALILATGWPVDKIKQVIFDANIEKMVYDCWVGRELYNLAEYGGLHQGEQFVKWFGEIIEQVTGDPDCTFKQWHEHKIAHPEKNMRDIIVEACNINTYFNEIFSWDGPNKDVPIRQALRASMAFPILFTPWAIGRFKYQDGGIQANCPISVYNQDGEPDPEALAIWLTGKGLIEHVEDGKPLPEHSVYHLYQQVYALIESSLNTQAFDMMHGSYKAQTVLCDTLGVGTLDFNLSQAQKDALIQSGYEAVMQYVKTHKPEVYRQYAAKAASESQADTLESLSTTLDTLSLDTARKEQDQETDVYRPSPYLAYQYLRDKQDSVGASPPTGKSTLDAKPRI